MSANITWRPQLSVSPVSGDQSVALTGQWTQSGGTQQYINQNFTSNTTNSLVSVAYNAPSNNSGGLQLIMILASQNVTLVTNGLNTADVQTVTMASTNGPTGGTFALAFKGAITAPVSYNASAATVQAALVALSTIGAGNMACTGGPLPGNGVVCTFNAALNTGFQPIMTGSGGGMTGGANATVLTITHTTPGLPQDTIQLQANIPVEWDNSLVYPCPFNGAVNSWYVSCNTAMQLQAKILQA